MTYTRTNAFRNESAIEFVRFQESEQDALNEQHYLNQWFASSDCEGEAIIVRFTSGGTPFKRPTLPTDECLHAVVAAFDDEDAAIFFSLTMC